MGLGLVLKPTSTPGASIQQREAGAWWLTLPAGPKDSYRLAQLDDYGDLPRDNFTWTPPVQLSVVARVSEAELAGTWGFGLWNDPFSLSLGLGGGVRRFPALPNAAWFFCAASPNFLSFRDDVPAQGFLAQVFRSPELPPLVLALTALGLPLLSWQWLARKLRPFVRAFIGDQSYRLSLDVREWHHYAISWRPDLVEFMVDGKPVFETSLSPRGRLGLVIWIDNQYAAYPPNGKVTFGKLPFPEPVQLEIKALSVDPIR